MSKQIIIHTLSMCEHCYNLKKALAAENLEFMEVDCMEPHNYQRADELEALYQTDKYPMVILYSHNPEIGSLIIVDDSSPATGEEVLKYSNPTQLLTLIKENLED